MGLYERAAWGVIIGLALMIVGGLMLWTYGARKRGEEGIVLSASGPEASATQRFHVRLARWFYLYGVGITIIGVVVLLRATLVLT